MTLFRGHRRAAWAGLLLLAVLAGCASPQHQAPVEDRPTGRARTEAKPAAPVEAKPGTYIVKPGDTLMRIGLETGQAWRDLARWNNIDNANVIEVGQVLRVVPPGVEPGVASPKPVASTKVESKPLDSRPVAASAGSSSSAASAASSAAGKESTKDTPKEADDDIRWGWPSAGPVVGGFDESRSKGLSIGGKAGDPVYAAADGRVVYAGNTLRGYGNLIIIKHNANYLSAYAHNQTLLVKEDQAVRKGQKIAEMGASDSDKVQLHFEIRKQGKPLDPARLLPAR
ncbi:peptidoglycan DD-metalloendopeptidase family protein [Ideonella sp. B7]|uniref:peptidoglycan DD-metalloendopeptidase family protein n=1 Tax=Ideonella benzenivorans TaxID=2831643 RepID=UPI001CECF986|nr:peptidoglycan DD-metalloendopeptidase family protein [Ideonella benzenivorans]MCA6217846.1 peptidoglycan DD-metalloendopeptidase family protein [Ideonella benzenivorans]